MGERRLCVNDAIIRHERGVGPVALEKRGARAVEGEYFLAPGNLSAMQRSRGRARFSSGWRSATTDGGIGMAAALGYEFLTSDGEDLEPIPGNLLALIRVEHENAIELPEIVAACDVQNPLLGPRGTAHVFQPAKKGANAKDIVALEEGLLNLADVLAK